MKGNTSVESISFIEQGNIGSIYNDSLQQTESDNIFEISLYSIWQFSRENRFVVRTKLQ